MARSLPACEDHKIKQMFKWGKGDPKYFRSLLDKYGSVFTVDLGSETPVIVFADPHYIKEFFTQPNHKLGNRSDGFLSLLGEKSLFCLSGEEHLSMKKVVGPTFHGDQITLQTAQTTLIAENDVGNWPENQVVQTRPLFMELYRKSIQDILWGTDRAELTDKLMKIIEDLLEFATHNAATVRTVVLDPRSPINGRYLQSRVDSFREEFAYVMREVRKSSLAGRTDIMSLLLSARDKSGNGLTDIELRDQAMTLTTAGHETTATQTSWLLDLLAHHPEIQLDLCDTAESKSPESDALYLRVIKEGLRLRPVIPNVLKQAKSELQIHDISIANNDLVLVSILLTHLNPAVWDDPYSYNPDRWLNPPTNNYAWIPFSAGIHRCIGTRLATEQMQTVLRAVFSKYEVLPVHKPEKQVNKSIMSTPKYGGEVFLKVRNE